MDLLQQFQIYEAVLQYEDGEEKCGTPLRHLDESIRKTLRNRKSVVDSTERRKSRRHSTGNTPVHNNNNNMRNNSLLKTNPENDDESSSTHSSVDLNNLNGSYKDSNKGKLCFKLFLMTSLFFQSLLQNLIPKRWYPFSMFQCFQIVL